MIVANSPPQPGVIALMRAHETKIRFLLAGGLNTLFGLAIFPVLIWFLAPLSLHYMIVLAVSQAICVVFAFVTNKMLVFKTRGEYFKEFGRFATFYIGSFAANLVALPILVELVRIPPIWSQLMFITTLIILSYFWHNRITFAPRGVIDP
jgi:putative flippase GtrA